MWKNIGIEIDIEGLQHIDDIHEFLHQTVSEELERYVNSRKTDEKWKYEIHTRNLNDSIDCEFEAGKDWGTL